MKGVSVLVQYLQNFPHMGTSSSHFSSSWPSPFLKCWGGNTAHWGFKMHLISLSLSTAVKTTSKYGSCIFMMWMLIYQEPGSYWLLLHKQICRGFGMDLKKGMKGFVPHWHKTNKDSATCCHLIHWSRRGTCWTCRVLLFNRLCHLGGCLFSRSLIPIIIQTHHFPGIAPTSEWKTTFCQCQKPCRDCEMWTSLQVSYCHLSHQILWAFHSSIYSSLDCRSFKLNQTLKVSSIMDLSCQVFRAERLCKSPSIVYVWYHQRPFLSDSGSCIHQGGSWALLTFYIAASLYYLEKSDGLQSCLQLF